MIGRRFDGSRGRSYVPPEGVDMTLGWATLLAACTKSDTGTGPGETATTESGFESESEVESCDVDVTVFNYADQASWVLSDPDCGGDQQSPIELNEVKAEIGEIPTLEFRYGTTPLHIINNGHAIEYEVDPDSNTLGIGGVTYGLHQFHLHAPGEHRFDGLPTDLELHLVHTAGTATAVVALFIVRGDEDHPWFEGAGLDALPAEAGTCVGDAHVALDLGDLIANHLVGEFPAAVHYTGSLTTPPCTEGVDWFLMGQYLELSAAQIEAFTTMYEGNNRDVQPVGDRTLVQDANYAN